MIGFNQDTPHSNAKTPPEPGGSRLSRRFFVGPMPKTLLSMPGGVGEIIRRADEAGDNRPLSRAMDSHAFHFFTRQGGKPEDWNDGTRANVRTELIRRWRESDWIRPLRRQSDAADHAKHWFGHTFEIGNVLGVPIVDKHASQVANIAAAAQGSERGTNVAVSSLAASSYVTAPSGSPLLSAGSDHAISFASSVLPGESGSDIYSSSTALLLPSTSVPGLSEQPRTATTTVLPRPILKKSTLTDPQDGTGRIVQPTSTIERDNAHGVSPANLEAGRSVHYSAPESLVINSLPSNDVPASRGDVLARTGDRVAESSAGATVEASTPERSSKDEIILRDRMLVRVTYTKSEGLPKYFDEMQSRVTCNLHYEDWAEFMVVWRDERMEIYEDYTLPLKEFLTGHKNLAFLIPLEPSQTSVSLFSFADLTFCILCPPTPVQGGHSKARSLFYGSKEGTNVFIFKVKSRTRAQDWLWKLWRHLGGQIPPSIEITCPIIDTRLKIDLAREDISSDKAYELFSPKHLIELVRRSMVSPRVVSSVVSRDWKYHIERNLQEGKSLALDWRLGAQLDWVWQGEDVEGKSRPWAVLLGLSLYQGKQAPHLEIRVADHFPGVVHLPDGTRLEEPPAVEGYLDRIKPHSQSKQRVYLVTHDGNLFALAHWNAYPPAPPSTHLSHIVGDRQADIGQYGKELLRDEVRRGISQIHSAYGVVDLRSIRSVRAALSEAVDEGEEGSLQNDEDEGGAEGLAKVQDKVRLQLRRSFEIVLASGPIVRLEAYSVRNCLEWIDKLQALVAYWTHRHREDAKLEIDVSYGVNQQSRVTPQLSKRNHNESCCIPQEETADAGASLHTLTTIYHWCALQNCRSITKCGRVFTRKGLRGQYKLSQLFLVSGYLIQFRVSARSALHRRRPRDIGLMDAYICSGHLAALALPRGELDPNSPSPPKRYDDGLETDEPDEDLLFMVWYRKTPKLSPDSKATSTTAAIPSLSAKFKIVAFKTRNKVERDAWCWALGCEIDKLARQNKDRERKLRETGTLANISH